MTTPSGQVSSAIEFVAKEPNFYFSVDDREFKATDLFESVILKVTMNDGTTTETDIINQVTFNGLTPEKLFNDADAENSAEYDGVYRGYVSGYYNGSVIDAKSLVYIGVKGDSDLNGKVEISDASLTLKYYAYRMAVLDVTFTGDADSDYETLAYFLSDVDTESKQGKDSADGSIDISDATNILKYYANDVAMLDPQWEDIIPTLVNIPGSLWEYKANNK